MSELTICPPELDGLEHIVGIDEVGVGSLAGPMVVAAVILPKGFQSEIVKDSKKLSEKKRKKAYDIIINEAIGYSIEFVKPHVIDNVNILNATLGGMHECLRTLERDGYKFEHILVDGNQFPPYKGYEHTCVVKGDNKFYSIAAASILAKVTRDEYMKSLAPAFPNYDWENNKGYGTKKHIDGILEHGVCEYHRRTFLKNILTE